MAEGFVEVFTGTLGGGKTLFAVERAIEHLARGGHVFANFNLLTPGVTRELAKLGKAYRPERFHRLTDDQAREFHLHVQAGTDEFPVMVAIDEAGLEFMAEDHAKTDRGLLAMNAWARKLKIQLVYISQALGDMNKKFRGKAGRVWLCRNLLKYKAFGWLPVPIPLMVRISFDNTRGGFRLERESCEMLPIPRRLFDCYDTDELTGRAATALKQMGVAEGGALDSIHQREDWEPGVETAICVGVLSCAFTCVWLWL